MNARSPRNLFFKMEEGLNPGAHAPKGRSLSRGAKRLSQHAEAQGFPRCMFPKNWLHIQANRTLRYDRRGRKRRVLTAAASI
jgi:hypothetical protein